MVRRILATYGRRRSSPRKGRSPDGIALRDTFKTYFPGAQWVGDGMQVPVTINGTRFDLNLELYVDASSGALVGLSVRNQEDAPAVIEAFDQGTTTTGQPPVALLLDNRPSNHTPQVEGALGNTILIRATPERPQNKAHVEGAFGLFSQVLPSLVLDTTQAPLDLARHLLWVVSTLWACTTNHRPRKDRGGRSRADLYTDRPSEDQFEQARRELEALAERQELARRTLEARRRPEVLGLLDSHFAQLGLLDPNRHIRIAIAAYPLDAILAGIATFEGKRSTGTLPPDADARYLLGIVRNVAAQAEGEAIARRLLELRLNARDQTLASLVIERDSLFALRDLHHACQDCADEAMATQSTLERLFWLDSLAGLIRSRGADRLKELYLDCIRRIYATFAVPHRERQDAARHLADQLVPLA
jgi:transposase InsO family protein